MARINNYKLKDGITKVDLLELGWKKGSWLDKNLECVSKFMVLNGSIEINMRVRTNPMDFDDFEDILVLDADFCQPYTPFYGDNYKKDVADFEFLENVISRYNQAMDMQGIFEIVEE